MTIGGAVEQWCILRTGSAQTLPLCKALCDDGFRAWTPTEVRAMRARRSVPAYDLTVALMPSIVFADYASVPDLITLSRSALPHLVWDAQAGRHVARGWPQFRVLRIAERYARVADRELAGLRRAERVGLTRAQRKAFVRGAAVRLVEGAGEGLRGVVDRVDGDGTFAWVKFPSFAVPWKVALHLLEVVRESVG